MTRHLRNAALVSFGLLNAGAIWAFLNIFSIVGVVQEVLFGIPYPIQTWDQAWDDTGVRIGSYMAAAGLLGTVGFGLAWARSFYVDIQGGDYWMQLREEARALAREDVADPPARLIILYALEIEAADGKRRPETVRRYVSTFGKTEPKDVPNVGDRMPSDEERDYLRDLREELKDAVDAAREAMAPKPGGPELETVFVEWGGVKHDAGELMTECQSLIEWIREISFR